MFLSDRVKDLEAENAKLREVVRQQGEFIQSMKQMIADFVYGDRSSLGRLRGGR